MVVEPTTNPLPTHYQPTNPLHYQPTTNPLHYQPTTHLLVKPSVVVEDLLEEGELVRQVKQRLVAEQRVFHLGRRRGHQYQLGIVNFTCTCTLLFVQ